ncbi:glycosyltransferase family 2 protein [Gaetbulibacter jejuensis]|uniref:Glycosyltransferase family 2 protein n=2 Tax=Gaetbulibacter jejuensis TaxID=584607 RepID=A0ABP3UUI1_9FLAO
MAGDGRRFLDKGIKIPKYKIEVNDRSLFEWSILSLSNFFSDEFIFISREEIWDGEFVHEICSKYNITKFEHVLIQQTTNGQATTAIKASHLIDPSDEVAIYNIDTYVKPGNIQINRESGVSGIIPVFRAEGDKWSFVEADKNGYVKQVTEKIRISDMATIGFYYFSSWRIFTTFYERYNQSIIEKYNEVYIAPMYQYLIDEGLTVKTYVIESNRVIVLGTPEDIDRYKNIHIF